MACCWVRRISCTSDFCEQNGAWRALEDIHGNRCGNCFSLLDTIRSLYEFLQSSLGCSEPQMSLVELEVWSWTGLGGYVTGWELSMQQWKSISEASEPLTVCLHRRWSTGGRRISWKAIWKALWIGWVFLEKD